MTISTQMLNDSIKKISETKKKKIYITSNPSKNQFDQLNLKDNNFIYHGRNILLLLQEIHEITKVKK